MGKKLKLIILSLAVVGLLAGALAAFGSVSARSNAIALSDTTPVMDYQDHGVEVMNPQERGTSDLTRSLDGISMNIDTTDLPVGAYTTWWVIFNNPSECTDGECGSDDSGKAVGNPTGGSVLWATGGIVGPDRMGHFSASLGVGLDAAPGPVLRGPGLTNPMGSEIHIVVRYHGPASFGDAAVLGAELTTVGGTCDTFPCYDPQVTVHTP